MKRLLIYIVYFWAVCITTAYAEQSLRANYKKEAAELRRDISRLDSFYSIVTQMQLDSLRAQYPIDRLLHERQNIRLMSSKTTFIVVVSALTCFVLFAIYTRNIRRKTMKAESQTAEAARQAQSEDIVKERLKSEISHDVRTPLNVVVGFAEVLSEESLDRETKREYCRLIQSNADSLLHYINGILELSRLESGKTMYTLKSCDVVKVCRKTIEQLNAQPLNRVKSTFKTELKELHMKLDIDCLQNLLTNLLTSADNDPDLYETTVYLTHDTVRKQLFFEIVNTPMAKIRFESRSNMIRHEINAHFIHFFGGVYETKGDDYRGPTVSFTLSTEKILGGGGVTKLFHRNKFI